MIVWDALLLCVCVCAGDVSDRSVLNALKCVLGTRVMKIRRRDGVKTKSENVLFIYLFCFIYLSYGKYLK